MAIYIDTSAIYAVLDKNDAFHKKAGQTWANLVKQNEQIVCNNYVVVETSALIQRNIGMNAIKVFYNDMMLEISVEWITQTQHQTIVNTLLATNRRRQSLVDCSSFETMRRLGIHKAFTFDKHFAEQGFEQLP